MIRYLVQHPAISYAFYAAACLLELSFVIGFFTKKYDRRLMVAFFVFLVMDYLVMRIIYFEWLPFVILLRRQSWIVKREREASSVKRQM
jgi:hypothetical protein